MPLTSVFLFLQHWWPSSKDPTDKIDKGPVHKIDKGAADTSKCLNLTTSAASRDLDTNCRLSSFTSAPRQIHQMSHFQQIQLTIMQTLMVMQRTQHFCGVANFASSLHGKSSLIPMKFSFHSNCTTLISVLCDKYVICVRTNICIYCNKYFVISGSWESPVCCCSSQIFVYTCRQTLQLPLISINVIISIDIKTIISVIISVIIRIVVREKKRDYVGKIPKLRGGV